MGKVDEELEFERRAINIRSSKKDGILRKYRSGIVVGYLLRQIILKTGVEFKNREKTETSDTLKDDVKLQIVLCLYRLS